MTKPTIQSAKKNAGDKAGIDRKRWRLNAESPARSQRFDEDMMEFRSARSDHYLPLSNAVRPVALHGE